MAKLIVKAPSVSEFFFSGSQSVKKGQEVAWILDTTFAFKTTEECGVSANKTPFVNLSAGQIFIIKKGMSYIFDRDTVVGLAYPQEDVQDIIIENDIYNNNMSTINIEANSAPTVSAGANQIVTVGESVTLYSTAVPVSPATISAYSWLINGSQVATTANYTYTPSVVGETELTLIVTDSDGRKAYDSVMVTAEAVPIVPPLIYTDTSQLEATTPEATWTPIFQITATQTDIDAVCQLDYTAGFSASWSTSGVYYPSSASIRLTIGGTVVYTDTIASPNPDSYSMWLKTATANFTQTITTGDLIKLEVYWTDANSLAGFGSSTADSINGDLQLTVNIN